MGKCATWEAYRAPVTGEDRRKGLIYCEHGETGPHETVDLPPGKTCADCYYVKRCVALFGAKPENDFCDFLPVAFREAPRLMLC